MTRQTSATDKSSFRVQHSWLRTKETRQTVIKTGKYHLIYIFLFNILLPEVFSVLSHLAVQK